VARRHADDDVAFETTALGVFGIQRVALETAPLWKPLVLHLPAGLAGPDLREPVLESLLGAVRERQVVRVGANLERVGRALRTRRHRNRKQQSRGEDCARAHRGHCSAGSRFGRPGSNTPSLRAFKYDHSSSKYLLTFGSWLHGGMTPTWPLKPSASAFMNSALSIWRMRTSKSGANVLPTASCAWHV